MNSGITRVRGSGTGFSHAHKCTQHDTAADHISTYTAHKCTRHNTAADQYLRTRHVLSSSTTATITTGGDSVFVLHRLQKSISFQFLEMSVEHIISVLELSVGKNIHVTTDAFQMPL